MANNTYAASTGLQELVIIYDKATDDPVGFMSADGKEILFGGPTSIVDAVARASAAAAQSTASGAATSAATANASLAAISSSVAAANTTATGAQSAAAAASTAATAAQNAASTAQTTATAASTTAASAQATAATALNTANTALEVANAGGSGTVTTTGGKRGLAATLALLNALAWAGGDTTSIIPTGNYNVSTFAELQTAHAAATAGQVIRITERSTITQTAQLAVKEGVTVKGGGGVTWVSGYAPAGATQADAAMLLLSSASEGANGNQTIENITFLGNNYQAAAAIYVRGRSNVKIKNCEFYEFNFAAAVFNGRANETDGPATTKAVGNGVYNCASTGCCVWVGAKPGGYASGILQVGSQVGFELKDSILVAKGRGSTNNGYCFKYYRNGYNDGTLIDNCTLRKSCDDGTPSNFIFCGEVWHDTGFAVRNGTFEGWFDLNGLTKGAYTYAYEFTNCEFGTKTLPTNTTTAAIELELGLVGNPTSDGLVQNCTFRNVRNAMYVYQKAGVGTAKFSNLTFRNNRLLNTRFGEFIAANAAEGGTSNWKIIGNTIRRLSSASAMNAGIMLPSMGDNTGWVIRRNVIAGFSTAPVLQNAPGGATSNVTVTDNIFHDNNGGATNVPVWNTTPTSLTVARNTVVDPLWDADDNTGMRSSLTGSVGADGPTEAPAVGGGAVVTAPATVVTGGTISMPLSKTFDQITTQLRQGKSYAFGTAAQPSGPDGVAIRNTTDLAAHFLHHQNPDPTYPYVTQDGYWTYEPFAGNTTNYVFGANSLTMQPTVDRPIESVITQINGLVSIPNNTSLPMATLGLTSTAGVTVGQWVILPYLNGTCEVVAKDAGNVTLRSLNTTDHTTGTELRMTPSGNGLIMWTTCRVARVSGSVASGATSLTVQSMPSGVSSGMRAAHIDNRGYVKRHTYGGDCTVSGNNVTGIARGMENALSNGDPILFFPAFKTGCLVTGDGFPIEAPTAGDVLAIETDWTVPGNAAGLCPDTKYMDTLAAYNAMGGSSIPLGSWGSNWLFRNHRPGSARNWDRIQSEIDVEEMWGNITQGLKGATFAFHNYWSDDKNYNTAMGNPPPPSTWVDDGIITYVRSGQGWTYDEPTSGGIVNILPPGDLSNVRKTQLLWEQHQITLYRNGEPIGRMLGEWKSADAARLIINASLGGFLFAKYLFYPQGAEALANGRVVLRSIKTWRR